MEKLKISTETKTLISSKPIQLENWFKEPILSIFYIYLLSNLLFAFFEISRGTLLGQYYLHMELHCYLFQLIIRSSWLKRSLIIVSLLAIIEYFFKKRYKEETIFPLPRQWKRNLIINWFKWAVPFLFIIQTYFTLKVFGSVHNHHLPLWKWETPFWSLMQPVFSSLPAWVYRFLDFIYVPGWGAAHWLFLFGLISGNETFRKRLFGVYGFSLMVGGVLHYLFPAVSPIYVAKDYFNYLPDALISWKYHLHCLHQQNLFLTKGAAVFTFLKGKAITPIAAFPSFHVGYALQLFLLSRDFGKRWLIAISFFFLCFIIIGSLILGYHYLIDDIAGMSIVYLMYMLVKKFD